MLAGRHDDTNAVRFHEVASFATTEVRIDDVEVGDLDAAAGGRELNGEVDGDFRLARAVIADDRDDPIVGPNNAINRRVRLQ